MGTSRKHSLPSNREVNLYQASWLNANDWIKSSSSTPGRPARIMWQNWNPNYNFTCSRLPPSVFQFWRPLSHNIPCFPPVSSRPATWAAGWPGRPRPPPCHPRPPPAVPRCTSKPYENLATQIIILPPPVFFWLLVHLVQQCFRDILKKTIWII